MRDLNYREVPFPCLHCSPVYVRRQSHLDSQILSRRPTICWLLRGRRGAGRHGATCESGELRGSRDPGARRWVQDGPGIGGRRRSNVSDNRRLSVT